MKHSKFSFAMSLTCAFALVCALGLSACGQSASEPGGTSAAPAASAAQSAEGTAAQEGGEAPAASAGESQQGGTSAGSQETATTEASNDSTHGDSLDADKALEGQTGAHPVTFSINAPGYSSSDGKIPIAIAGTKSDGTAVDATAYLDAGGNGLELAPGSYTVTVIESPLMSGGRFFRAPGKSWSVKVPSSLGSGESVSVSGSINFTEMDLSELTEDEVNTAYTYAVSGGLSKSTANAYKKELLKAAGLE